MHAETEESVRAFVRVCVCAKLHTPLTLIQDDPDFLDSHSLSHSCHSNLFLSPSLSPSFSLSRSLNLQWRVRKTHVWPLSVKKCRQKGLLCASTQLLHALFSLVRKAKRLLAAVKPENKEGLKQEDDSQHATPTSVTPPTRRKTHLWVMEADTH